MDKLFFRLGMLSGPWWVVTLAIFGALYPNYSHLYKAVSELGAFGAPHALAMNVLCLFLTGLFVILSGVGFRNFLLKQQYSTSAAWWVVILGVMLAGASVPADMDLRFASPWTVLHGIFVLLGVVPFFVASWKTHRALRDLNIQSRVVSHFPVLIIPVFLLHGLLDQGGLVQRLTILIVLTWVGLLSRHVSKAKCT
ncbi:hypothetical protein GCM10008090_29710 [Arenicella chitinivorans]|uniref:DUF998 domain-containing protein n=1 Tax=Arenicella chitinivorans TaxID=1329800 RepID=A0A918S2X1_9GAMM|nr:DUF998 domain-containing protein [Arenicella chitinivorans]GHA18197.1 hypothetical protein GCM10008090_29710 [Arenicella chitinivorans]